MRPLLLGEQPLRNGDPRRPFDGRSAHVLCSLAGIVCNDHPGWWEALGERFLLANASVEWSPRWNAQLARTRVIYLDMPPIVVAVGARSAQALGLPRGLWLEWMEHGDHEVCAIPHPSGRNLLLNLAETRERTGQVLREALERAGNPLPPPAMDVLEVKGAS